MGYKNTHFNKHQNQHKYDFVGFLDFECTLQPGSKLCQDCRSLRCKCDKSFSEVVSHQDPIAFSFVVLNQNDEIVHEHTFAGPDAGTVFMNHLMEFSKNYVDPLLLSAKKIIMNSAYEKDFFLKTTCYLCSGSFCEDNPEMSRS